MTKCNLKKYQLKANILYDTGKLGYDGPLYDGLLSMTDDMLGPSPMHILCISWSHSKFSCM